VKHLRTARQVRAFLSGNDWECCEVLTPVPVYMHPTLCPAWVDAGTALALTYQTEIARLQSDNERLRDKLKKAKR